MDVILSVALVAVASAHPYERFGPLAFHGGLYGLGLNGEMSYGQRYPLHHPEYIAGPPKRADFGKSVTVKEPIEPKQPEHLHDFHTGPHRTLEPYSPHHNPGQLNRPIDLNVFPVHPAGIARVDPQHLDHGPREPPPAAGPHGVFRTPLPKEGHIPNAVYEGSIDREAKLGRPFLSQGPLSRPVFNRGPVLDSPQQNFINPYGGKGSFGVAPYGAYGPVHPNTSPYLTPISRFSDGYVYHRVPLALVEGGFAGHYLGTPVVHGIVKAGVPVSLIRGW